MVSEKDKSVVLLEEQRHLIKTFLEKIATVDFFKVVTTPFNINSDQARENFHTIICIIYSKMEK